MITHELHAGGETKRGMTRLCQPCGVSAAPETRASDSASDRYYFLRRAFFAAPFSAPSGGAALSAFPIPVGGFDFWTAGFPADGAASAAAAPAPSAPPGDLRLAAFGAPAAAGPPAGFF